MKEMTLRKGLKVWVEDKDLAWVAAEVTDFIGKQVQVLTENGKKVSEMSVFLGLIFVAKFLLFGGALLL